MRCDEARRNVSAVADGEDHGVDAERLNQHLGSCDECRDFEDHVLGLRTLLRVEAVDTTTDVVDAVLARVRAIPTPPPIPIERRRRRAVGAGGSADDGDTSFGARERLLWPVTALWAGRGAISAAAAVGFLAGAIFVGVGDEPGTPAAADLPDQLASVQGAVTSLAADIQVTEYGRPDRDGARVFTGHLLYGGPEELELALAESGPSRERVQGSGAPGDGDVQLSVTGDRWSLDSVRGCMPTSGRAACPDGASRVVREVTGRAPFSEAAPMPLELVAPVETFTLGSAPPSLGERTIAGRDAVGVTVSAAQVARFVEQLSPAGDLRAVYPTDPVEMWLDREDLVPLALVVYAGSDPERERWAAMQDYDDRAGDRILAFTARDVRINDVPVPARAGADHTGDAGTATERHRPPELSEVDEGFVDGPAPAVPTPADLPAAFTPSRSGVTRSGDGPAVEVRSWTDGRAWVKVEATEDWTAEHLFGGLGVAVRTVDLGDGGRGYLSADGRKVALHTDDLDVVVTGSVPTDELVDLAAGLGLVGVDTPPGWRESDATTLARAAATLPKLLTPGGLDGFGRPAVRVAPDETVTQVYAGPGDRGFVLTQSSTPDLPPPTDDTLGVEVRGRAGRYSAELSQLEWSERGSSFSLASRSLSLPELLDIAATLKTP